MVEYKKWIASALFLIVIAGTVNHLTGKIAFSSWIQGRYNDAKNLIYTAIEKIEQKLFLNIKNIEKYQYFKGKSDLIQARINAAFDTLREDTTIHAIQEIQQLLNQLIIEEERLLKEAKAELSSHDYEILKKEIHGLITVATNEIGRIKIQGSLAVLLKDKITPEIVNKVNRFNAYRILNAYTRKVETLTEQENEFLLHRNVLSHARQQKYFNKDLMLAQALNIGLVFSGGGLRATTLTAGYLQGLKQIGCFDMAQYMASLSGSIWAVMLLMHQGDTDKVERYLLSASKKDTLDILSLKRAFKLSLNSILSDVVWPRIVFDQPLRSVDALYGSLLATAFFENDSRRYHYYLADQWGKINKGQLPFPLYASISFVKDAEKNFNQYHWIEFNPVEVVDLQERLAVPAFSFGRKFFGGASLDRAPGIADYAIMGAGGSAYTVNFKDLKDMALRDFSQEIQTGITQVVSAVKNNVLLLALKGLADVTLIGGKRVSPAQFNNPWFAYPDVQGWLKNKKYLTLVDAGIDINLPVPLLLRKERQMDVLIVCDSSGNIEKPGNVEMQKVLLYAKKLGYTYEKLAIGDESCSVYQDRAHAAPDIIYINYKNNHRILHDTDPQIKNIVNNYNQLTFDYQKCLQKTCETFNFDYSPHIMHQIIGRGLVNVVGQKNVIQKILNDRLNYKAEQIGVDVYSDKE